MQIYRSLKAAIISLIAVLPAPTFALPRSQQALAEFKREKPCPANGNRYGPCPGWQIDHVAPLKCGGPDHKYNMQWLTVADHKAKTKREAKHCRRPTKADL